MGGSRDRRAPVGTERGHGSSPSSGQQDRCLSGHPATRYSMLPSTPALTESTGTAESQMRSQSSEPRSAPPWPVCVHPRPAASADGQAARTPELRLAPAPPRGRSGRASNRAFSSTIVHCRPGRPWWECLVRALRLAPARTASWLVGVRTQSPTEPSIGAAVDSRYSCTDTVRTPAAAVCQTRQ